MSFAIIWLGTLVTIALCFISYLVTPPGRNQEVYRSSFILTLVCLYLMWVITYLAQLHPLISPRRSDLRTDHFT